MFVSAIIAAGGRGLRFGGDSPKQLLSLGGRPILARSVDAFVSCDLITEIVVALPADLAAEPPAYLYGRGKPVAVVSGGEQRRESVANAFARVSDRAEIVVIHDAARPLVSDELIRRTVAAASETGAAIAAIRAHDTVKQTRMGIGQRNQTPTDFLQQDTAWFERQLINSQIVGEFRQVLCELAV